MTDRDKIEQEAEARIEMDLLTRMPVSVSPEALAGWLKQVAAGEWIWPRNSRCKYVTLKIDTRRGAFRIEDRDGKPIAFDELRFQYGKAADAIARREHLPADLEGEG